MLRLYHMSTRQTEVVVHLRRTMLVNSVLAPNRRGLLRGGLLALLALQLGACGNNYEPPDNTGKEDVPVTGLNQYDMLAEIYGDDLPNESLAFQVRRNGEFVYPDDSEFEIDEDGNWLYVFKDTDEAVAFFPIPQT